MMMFALLFVAAILTSIISAVVGMAGGVTLLALMTFFLPLQQIIPIHGAVQLVSNSTRTFLLRKEVLWPVFKWYLVGLPLGTAVATWGMKHFSSSELAAVLVIVLIWYVLFKPKKMPALNIPYWGFLPLSFVIGVLNPFVGATGPMQASFFLREDWTREQIVATKGASQALGHVLKIPAFIYLSFDYLEFLPLIALMSLGVLIGTPIGVKILKGINDKVFRWLYQTALFLASLKLIYNLL